MHYLVAGTKKKMDKTKHYSIAGCEQNTVHTTIVANRQNKYYTLGLLGGGAGCGAVGRALYRHAAVRQGIFLLGDNFQCRLPLTVSVIPPSPPPLLCNRMQQHLCARQRSKAWAAIFFFFFGGTHKILHAVLGMGSAALAAAVQPYPGKATRISCKGQMKSTHKKKLKHT